MRNYAISIHNAKTFAEVFSEELHAIEKSGSERSDLNGLAFSGGGIRSATFNLGIIQSLAGKKLLGRFDYLSTVSGGGYIGSWLSAQIHRLSGVDKFQDALNSSLKDGKEIASIKWLRSYSNYLTPKTGLSGDTLCAIGTWLRNTLLNQTALALFFVAIVLLLQLAPLALAKYLGWLDPGNSGMWLLASILLIFCAIFSCALSLPKLRCCSDNQQPQPEQPFVRLIIAIIVLAAYSMSMWMYATSVWTRLWLGSSQAPALSLAVKLANEYALFDGWSSPLLRAIQSAYAPVVIASLWAVIYLLPWIASQISTWRKAEVQPCKHPAEQHSATPFWFACVNILSALFAGAFGGWLISQLAYVMAQQSEAMRLWWASGFGTPLMLLIFCSILVLHQGLMARLFRVSQLEWWSRLGGYLLLIAAAWAGIHVLLIYAPPLLDMLEYKLIAAGGLAWVAHSLAGVMLGKAAEATGKNAKRWPEIITRAAPYVFVLGLLVIVASAVHALLHKFGSSDTPLTSHLVAASDKAPPHFADFLAHALQINNSADVVSLCYVLLACALAFLILARRLDVNLFSIHHFYRNRLTRCYLGAGRNDRMPNSFTGFDPCDDIKLAELKQRPLHLVNTALNMVSDGNLAWQDRKAYSFTFSPLSCGFQFPPNASQTGGGYCDADQYMGGVRLGTAMAASGAAASPGMGYHSSPAVAFLLTVFNVRLGHWCPNTRSDAIKFSVIKRESPQWGGKYLLKELFSQTNDADDFVYLSDGGHFENLAVYELVRRRCRNIMVVDAGQDEARTFEDLANLMRKIYIDFGVKIDLHLDALRMDKDRRSQSCYTLGDISYPPEHDPHRDEDCTGILLYIKPGLLQDLPEDIRQYAATHDTFPHQNTADQFFDEAQFESYRHLGSFLMDNVLNSINQARTPSGKSWSWIREQAQ